MVAIRGYCPLCDEEQDAQLVRVLGNRPEAVEAPGCCCTCDTELVLRAFDPADGGHSCCHELLGFAATPFASYWSFVCSCGWRSNQPCENREDAATAWARHAAAWIVRERRPARVAALGPGAVPSAVAV